VNSKATISVMGRCLLLFALAGFIFLSGCTKRPSKEELTALDEACAAARAAEQKLDDLKRERSSLESELEGKKSELRDLEEQRDAIKAQLEEKVNEQTTE
jgi:septal ring factor EnvC (AmiA/AmiB activator)